MILTIMFLLTNLASGMTMVPISSDVIVTQSAIIGHGRVTAVNTQKQNNVIYTFYTFQIDGDGLIKSGGNSSNTITIKSVGGKVEKEILDVPGNPTLKVGGEYVLFLEDRGAYYNLYGANQGCMKVAKDPVNGSKIVLPCANRFYNSIFVNQSGVDSGSGKIVTLTSFIEKIKEYLNR